MKKPLSLDFAACATDKQYFQPPSIRDTWLVSTLLRVSIIIEVNPLIAPVLEEHLAC